MTKIIELSNGWEKVLFSEELTVEQQAEYTDENDQISQMFFQASGLVYPSCDFMQCHYNIIGKHMVATMAKTNRSALMVEIRENGMQSESRLYSYIR